MKILTTILLATISTVAWSRAQQAPPADPPVPPAAQMPPGAAGMEEAPTTVSMEFVQRSNFILSKIKEDERRTDPFGFPMDPANAADKVALSEQFEGADEVPVLNASAFKTAIEGLPISGIYPQRQTVVIGARSFSKGQQFGMRLDDLTIRLEVERIQGNSIYFRDVDTKEMATFNFNPTPVEFEPIYRNSKQERGEGIVPMGELFIVD